MSARPGQAQRSHKARKPRPDLSWQEHAQCLDVDPEMFFDPTRYAQAQLVCHGCPVKMQCREYGKSMGGGVWGGRVFEYKPPRGHGEFLLQPCGTEAAYRRHRRAGEQPCPACLAAGTRARLRRGE
jgi:hypothetical protein